MCRYSLALTLKVNIKTAKQKWFHLELKSKRVKDSARHSISVASIIQVSKSESCVCVCVCVCV